MLNQNLSTVTKPHFILLALFMLLTSSCAMKHLLWDYIGADTKIPAKALRLSDVSRDDAVDELALCAAADEGFLIDEAGFLPNVLVKAPWLLFFAAVFVPWALSWLSERRNSPPAFAISDLRSTVPIYLRLGRLVYYG